MPLWTKLEPVSTESRLNHIYPQIGVFQATNTADTVPFIWHVQSEFPFAVASGSGIQIRSSLTEAIL